jgi:hypothetical protein
MSRRAPLVFATAALVAALALDAPAALAADWVPATPVPAVGVGFFAPRVAMDAAGDSVAAWRAYSGTEEWIEASSRPAGGAWSAATVISSPDTEVAVPEVAIAPSGEATVVWATEGADLKVRVAQMSPTGTWNAPLTISKPNLKAFDPALAVDSAGNVLVAWEQEDEGHRPAEVSEHRPGGGWTAPVKVSSIVGEVSSTSVAVDDAGDAVVAWTEESEQVWAAARHRGGFWDDPIEVSASGREVREPHAAMDPTGEAVVLWTRSEPLNYVAQAAAISPAGALGKVATVSAGAPNAYIAQVAIDASGEAVAIWEDSSGTYARVEGATRPFGSGWSEAAPLTPADQFAGEPDLALSPAGLAVLVWQGGPAMGKPTAYGATRTVGGAWSGPKVLPPSGTAAYAPTAATDADGDAVAVWEANGGSEVEAAGFDGAPPRIASASIPGGGTAGAPLSFSLTASDVWSGAAVRWSFGDGTEATGPAVSHAYAKAGTYAVTATATDGVGNAASRSGTVTVAAAGTTPAAPRGSARAARTAMVRKGMAALTLSCGGAAPCAGVAKLLLPAPKKRGAGGRADRRARVRRLVAGKASFQIAASGKKVVRIRLAKFALARLGQGGGHLPATLGGTGVTPGTVTLDEARRRRPRR